MIRTTAMKNKINLCFTSLLAMEDNILRALSVMPENSWTLKQNQNDKKVKSKK